MSGEWVELEVLPGGYGDALLLRYGNRKVEHAILIDAGPDEEATWVAVSTRLRALTTPIDLFVVTHIDVDHIAGTRALFADDDLAGRIDAVWFNGYRHLERAADWLGGIDGELLTTAIRSRGYPWNRGFAGAIDDQVGGPILVPTAGPLPRVALPGGATAVMLSPSPNKLTRLMKSWRKVVEDAGLKPGQGAHLESPRKPVADDWLGAANLARAAAKATQRDTKPANGSSIAFAFEWGTFRLLMAADAHPDLLTANLARLAVEQGSPKVVFDVVKLPHHASASNVTNEMLALIECRDWMISTNGARFKHPDDIALARVLTAAPGSRLHANYDSDRIKEWAAFAPPKQHGYELLTPTTGTAGSLIRLG